ncbi:MAG TPA: polysaccharide pyruvyl transferase family protein [Chitinophaga sp.]|uniref:polysaccharide pyruvyl transferase family protein n=1 Tax=Chitinophaga sp. TaxID=1869181 RepID=UPI002CBFCC2E|nr:polysaccharide pyruvyl transferase family protein [Chitinophaga sp.]HVI48416.1 polysaccharide pyruvyl transferase family protein [Chitinophaga sp.]
MATKNTTFSGSIFLTGFFGAANVGDEAVSLAVYEGVRTQLPGAVCNIVTRSPAYTRDFTGITDAVALKGFYPSQDFWSNFLLHYRSARKSDLIVIGGGGILQDVHSWTTIPAHLLPACIGILFNRRVMTVGIGVGPIKSPWLKRLTAFTCNRMVKVQVRDEESKRVLKECGVDADKITVTADVVPSLELQQHVTKRPAAHKVPVVALAFRKWPDLDEAGLVGICSRLIDNGVHIRMLGYESAHDKKFYEQLIDRFDERYRDKISIHVPADLDDALQEVRHADFLLSMRLHGCVFAAAMGISFVAVPYDHKVSEFMRRLSLEDRIVPMDKLSPAYADRILECLQQPDFKAPWKEAFDKQQQLSRSNFTCIPELLETNVSFSDNERREAKRWIRTLLWRGMKVQMKRPVGFFLRKMSK